MAKPSEGFFYLPLQDAKKYVNGKVNLLATVTEIGVPVKSRGTDYVLTLKIADQSLPASGLSVNFFAENTGKLPHVRSSGDIVSLHRVVMKIYDGEFYCVFNKKLSSFALFEGKRAVGLSSYQSSLDYHPTNYDEECLLQLRTWLLNHQSEEGLNDYSLQLMGAKINHVFDLVCKVLHVCETPECEWMLFVWDGTDTPSVNFQMDLDNEGENPCPLHLEALPLPREILCTFPRVGTVLRIIAGKFFEEIPQLQSDAHWVKIRNVTCELQSGMWKGVLQPNSKIRFLSDEDGAVLLHQKNYNDRISSEVKRQPLTSLPQTSRITGTDYENVAYATLMDSLTHPEVTHKCQCVVRVVAAYPWCALNLGSPVDGHYRIRLTLEDPTARIHAYIFEEDGVKFFDGYPPADALTSKMNKLLGIKDVVDGAEGQWASRDPPWVCCCLKSYYLDKSNPWESRRYRIFGTMLLG